MKICDRFLSRHLHVHSRTNGDGSEGVRAARGAGRRRAGHMGAAGDEPAGAYYSASAYDLFVVRLCVGINKAEDY